MAASNKSLPAWLERLEPQFDTFLKCGEVLMVSILTIAMCGFVVYEIFWIGIAFDMTARQERLADTLRMLSDNWKAALLLLIPLFYRPIRMFLEKVKRFAGMETEHEAEVTDSAKNADHQSETMDVGTQASS